MEYYLCLYIIIWIDIIKDNISMLFVSLTSKLREKIAYECMSV